MVYKAGKASRLQLIVATEQDSVLDSLTVVYIFTPPISDHLTYTAMTILLVTINITATLAEQRVLNSCCNSYTADYTGI